MQLVNGKGLYLRCIMVDPCDNPFTPDVVVVDGGHG